MVTREIDFPRAEARFLVRWGGPLGVLCWVAGLGCCVAALNWFSISQGYAASGEDALAAAIRAASRAQAYGLGGAVLLILGCYLRTPVHLRWPGRP